MERGLYIAASGMVAEQMRQDAIANNLANASTPGYKADRVTQSTFNDLLLSNTQTGQPVGGLGTGVFADRMTTDFADQPLKPTDQPLDLAIAGNGWFGVRTPNGVQYTRNGQFTASAQGTLIDQNGNNVLGAGGGPVQLDAQGQVTPGSVGVFRVANPAKQGNNYVTGAAAGQDTGSVRTGSLESSGLDPATAMVDMIASFRSYEAGQRAIQTIDQSLQEAASQVANPHAN
ncbi:MAG TPA: flagellar hook-basal body protein [Conexibacter sp.]|jgi:flagellar basal-body rod protein FlgG